MKNLAIRLTHKEIFIHNEDWAINSKRCPMYLSSISEIDDSWSVQEKLALEKLMRIKLLKEIKSSIQHIGKEKFLEIENKLNFLAKYNLSIIEIEQVPDEVFKRLLINNDEKEDSEILEEEQQEDEERGELPSIPNEFENN